MKARGDVELYSNLIIPLPVAGELLGLVAVHATCDGLLSFLSCMLAVALGISLLVRKAASSDVYGGP